MGNLNKIFWQNDNIGVITNLLESTTHSHWMMQLFLSVDEVVKITINDEEIIGQCIIVDKNIPHSIYTNKKIYFTMLIEPTSMLAKQLKDRIKDKGCWKDDIHDVQLIQLIKKLIKNTNVEIYNDVVQILYDRLHLYKNANVYDERITQLLQYLTTCNCDNHNIDSFASKVSLSSSRLSHLFKEQIGVPLKSYILLHQIETAVIHLLEGKNVTQAALLAGFDSPSHFAATIKKAMGMPITIPLKDSVFLKV